VEWITCPGPGYRYRKPMKGFKGTIDPTWLQRAHRKALRIFSGGRSRFTGRESWARPLLVHPEEVQAPGQVGCALSQ
jgi:hypothetical protein